MTLLRLLLVLLLLLLCWLVLITLVAAPLRSSGRLWARRTIVRWRRL